MKETQREVLMELIEAKARLAAIEVIGTDTTYELHRVAEAEASFDESFKNEQPEED
jgi:hypothetical protein